MKAYQLTPSEVVARWDSDQEEGLANREVEKRRRKYGPNALEQRSQVKPWEILLDQFKNVLVLLLIFASGISYFIGEGVEALAILAVIVINALFGFITEYKAKQSVEALRKLASTTAKILREGQVREVDAEEIVPGDIVVLEEGDRVPADARLLRVESLAADESSLTGESEAINKMEEVIEEDSALAERFNMVFMGTVITRGNATAVVTATGENTEVGRVGELLQSTESRRTPLEMKLDEMGRSLIVVTLGVTAFVALVGVARGHGVIEMLRTGTALAIAAVPEGLPAVATITLAIGMNRMAAQNALVKRLPAVETLGSTTVICTDKTGTLTENEMTVTEIDLPERSIAVSGTGYGPKGDFEEDGRKLEVSDDRRLSALLRAGVLCSNAEVFSEEGRWEVAGDPTEGALVTAGLKAGISREALEDEGFSRTEELPFSSDRKYMGVYYDTPDGTECVFVKGAPDVVIQLSGRAEMESGTKNMDENLREQFLQRSRELAGRGLRVLAIARKTREEGDIRQDIRSGLTLLGFIGIMDPPRQDVRAAIDESIKAGIRVLMITGDQSDTALAIAKQVSIASEETEVISGPSIDDYSPEELEEVVQTHSVFARVSPENKLDILRALTARNEVTAMTGDGVNDAPALKSADIGVAMGVRGTAVAKEAADMIILDDAFSTIVAAIKRGRMIFDNIQKFIHYLFSCNLSEIILIFLGILLGLPTPLLALQILWLNLVTDVFPALVLGWEPAEKAVMERPPRDPDRAIITRSMWFKVGFQALVIASGPLLVYLHVLDEFSATQSRTIAFMALAMVQLLHVFDVRRVNGLGFDRSSLSNKPLWGAVVLTIGLQLFAVYTPVMQTILHTEPLTPAMWLLVGLAAVVPVGILQGISLVRHRNTAVSR